LRGGIERSVYADLQRMIEWFGPSWIKTDEMLDRVFQQLA